MRRLGAEVAAQALGLAAVGAAAGQVGEEGAGLGEEDGAALATRLHAEGLGDETFPDPGGAAQQHGGVLVDEAPAGQLPELRLGDLRVVAEVEVAQVAGVLEARRPDAARDVIGIAPGEFVIQQQQQKVQRVQATLAGFLRARPDGVAHAGELELA